MKREITEDFIVEVFIDVDDFCILFDSFLKKRSLGKTRKERNDGLTRSEIISILILYQHSGYKTFKYFYKDELLKNWNHFFPKLVCYARFTALIGKVFLHMSAYSKTKCFLNSNTGISYVDSKRLPVCHTRRIRSHRVFKGLASRGKSSTGWYFGLKIHLIINHLGDILDFQLTPANISDNNPDLLRTLFQRISGKVFGDKGYLSKLFEEFFENGIHLITKVRKNMKNKLISYSDKMLLLKRGVIESVNDILMNILNIEHTRHRSAKNGITHIMAAIAAFDFYNYKPSVILDRISGIYP